MKLIQPNHTLTEEIFVDFADLTQIPVKNKKLF